MNERAFLKEIDGNSLSGAYYLHGGEPYSRNQALQKALATMDGAMGELNVQRLRQPAAADVINACETLPLFAEKRMVVAEELDADAAEALCEYVPRVPETSVLLVVRAGKAPATSALYKAFAAIDRAVEFRAFDPKNDGHEAREFIELCAGRCGSAVEPGAARLLLEWVGYDQGTLETTVVRLCDYAGRGRRVTMEDVRACVPPSTEHTVFQILDRLVAGNRKGALTALLSLLRDGADTSMRLASFFDGQLRMMLLARQLLDMHTGEQAIVQALGGSPYAAKMALQKARKCTREQIVSAMTAFADIDYLQKSGAMKDDDAMLLSMFKCFTKGENA